MRAEPILEQSSFISENKKPLLVLAGVIIGFLNGFFGGGGGMLCVPVLTFILGLDAKKSHATALSIMLPLSLVSAGIYLLSGEVDFTLTLPVTVGFTLGGAVGAMLLNKLQNKVISLVFSLVMIAAGIKFLV